MESQLRQFGAFSSDLSHRLDNVLKASNAAMGTQKKRIVTIGTQAKEQQVGD